MKELLSQNLANVWHRTIQQDVVTNKNLMVLKERRSTFLDGRVGQNLSPCLFRALECQWATAAMRFQSPFTST